MALTNASVLHYWSSRYGVLPIIGGKPTHSRNSAGSATDVRGEIYSAIVNTPRFTYEVDRSTPANEKRAALLLEGARTNLVSQPRDLSISPWVDNGIGTAVKNAIGIDGTANAATTLTDASSGTIFGRQFTATVPNNSAAYTFRAAILKDSAGTSRYVAVESFISGGAGVSARYHLNTTTGALTTSAAASGGARVVDSGAYWIVEIMTSNNSSGNTLVRLGVYPAIGNVSSTSLDIGATGSCVVDACSIEAGTTGTSPILTTGGATRSADAFNWAFPVPAQGMMIFSRHIERATLAATLWAIVSPALVNPAAYLYGATAGAGGYSLFQNNGSALVGASAGTATNLGDTVDLCASILPTGAVRLIASTNGAAVSDSGATAANTLAPWSSPTQINLAATPITGNPALSPWLDLRIVKYADVVASTAQGIMDELRAFELGPNGDIL